MNHQPRKRFGQNFLESSTVIQQIFNALHLQKTDKVLEIGPGLGALTKPLLTIVPTLTAIEIDNDLHAYLTNMPENQGKLNVINADALNFDYNALPKNTRIIGNLPYNISTPLLLKLLRALPSIQDMHFMLQKEVVDRLSASPGSKTYGRLSVMTQYHCMVEPLIEVPANAFRPAPKVDSAFVRLIPLNPSPYPQIPWETLEKVVAQAFSMRRKTLANSLKGMFTAEELQSVGIDPKTRAEQLSVMDYVKLCTHST